MGALLSVSHVLDHESGCIVHAIISERIAILSETLLKISRVLGLIKYA
jgi:hypothetical protein